MSYPRMLSIPKCNNITCNGESLLERRGSNYLIKTLSTNKYRRMIECLINGSRNSHFLCIIIIAFTIVIWYIYLFQCRFMSKKFGFGFEVKKTYDTNNEHDCVTNACIWKKKAHKIRCYIRSLFLICFHSFGVSVE